MKRPRILQPGTNYTFRKYFELPYQISTHYREEEFLTVNLLQKSIFLKIKPQM
jgi:hypothetical protein